jgi:integrase
MAKLTERAIAALDCPPDRKDRLVFDDALPGLAVRVANNGHKAFLAQYTIQGTRRRVPLGRWGAITLEQARLAARSVMGDVAKGLDPAKMNAAARANAAVAAKAEKLTLEALIKQWETLALTVRRESYRNEALRALKLAYAGHLKQPAGLLTRDDALRPLDKLVKAGKGAIAGRTLAYGRACYRWALRRGMVAASPFDGLPIAAGTVSRDRVLTDDEVATIWRHAGELGEPFAALVQLLLLTAQRREEVGGMRWSELSDDRTTWTIPKERAKNGRAHLVHLAPAARAILATVPRLAKSDLVFTTTGKTAVSGFGHAKARLDAAIAKQRGGEDEPRPLPGWRLHDFRRTAVTWMAEHGVAPHVADRLLNHVTGTISGVAAVYQRGEFLAERKAALEAWAAFVAGVTGRRGLESGAR